jgi:hypothetical protein
MWPFEETPYSIQNIRDKHEKLRQASEAKRKLLSSLTPLSDTQKAEIFTAPEDPASVYLPEDRASAQLDAALRAGLDKIQQQNQENWRQWHEQGSLTGYVKNTAAQVADKVSNIAIAPVTVPTAIAGMGMIGQVDQAARDAYFGLKQVAEGKHASARSRAELDAALLKGVITPEEHQQALAAVNAYEGNLKVPEDLSALQKPTPLLPFGSRLSDMLDLGIKVDGFNRPTQGKTLQRGEKLIDISSTVYKAQEDTIGKVVDDTRVNKLAGDVYDAFKGTSDKSVLEAIADNKTGAADIVTEAAAEIAMFLSSGGLSALGKVGRVVGTLAQASVVGESATEASAQVLEGMQEILQRDGTITADQIAGLIAGGAAYAGLDYAEVGVLANALKKNTPLLKALQKQDGDGRLVRIAKDTLNRTGAVTAVGAKEGLVGGAQGGLEETVLKDNYDLDQVDMAKVATDAVLETIGATGVSGTKEGLGLTRDTAKNLLMRSQDSQQSGADNTNTLESSMEIDKEHPLSKIRDAVLQPELSSTDKEKFQKDAFKTLSEMFDQQDALVKRYESLQGSTEPSAQQEAVNIDQQIKAINEQIRAAQKLLDEIVVATADTEVEKAAEKLATQDTDAETAQVEAMRLITAASRDPNSISTDALNKILSSAALTPAQRTYFEAFAAARESVQDVEELNGVGRTTNDVIYGNPELGWKGIKQYRRELASHLAAGNEVGTKRTLQQLSRFAEHQSQKAQDFRTAFEAIKEMKLKRGELSPERREQLRAAVKQVSENYTQQDGKPYRFTARTPESLVTAVEAEAQALNNLLVESQAQQQLMKSMASASEQAKAVREEVSPIEPEQTTERVDVTQTAANARPAPVNTATAKKAPVSARQTDSVTPATEASVMEGTAAPAENAQTAVSNEPAPITQQTEQVQQTTQTQEQQADSPVDSDEVDQATDTDIAPDTQEEGDEPKKKAWTDSLFTGFSERIRGFFSSKQETQNLLAADPDFMRKLREDDWSSIEERLGEPLSARQKEALKGFVEFHDRVVDFLTQHLKEAPEKQSDSIKQSFSTRLLRNPNNPAELNDAAVAALSLSMFTWLGTQASGTIYNNDRTINHLIGRRGSAPVPNTLRELMIDAGTGANTLAENLGRQARQLLGIQATTHAPENAMKWLEADLGNVAILVLRDPSFGALTYSQIAPRTILDTLPENQQRQMKLKANMAPLSFYRAATVREHVEGTDVLAERPAPIIRSASELLSGTDNLMSRVFGEDLNAKEPSFHDQVPITRTMRGTRQKLSEAVRKKLGRAQRVKWEIKDQVVTDLDRLSTDTQLALFGYKPGAENHVMRDRQKSVKAQNEAAVRSYEHFKRLKEQVQERLEAGKAATFHFSYFVARQMRTHMDSNTVNPQADKNHRFLVRQQKWVTEIDPNNSEQVDRFMLALAEGLDLDRDKHMEERTLKAVAQRLSEADAKKAIKALQQLRQKADLPAEMRQAYELAIQQFVLNAGTGMHAFDVLVQHVNYLEAKDSGQTFTADVMPEVDGVTNGPIIGLIQFAGAATAERLKQMLGKGGIYFDGRQNLAEWKLDPNNLDAYQETSNGLMHALQASLGSLKAEDPGEYTRLKQALKYFGSNIVLKDDGTIEVARKMGKQPTMITVYGAGDGATKSDTVEAFLEGVRDALEGAYKAGDVRQANSIIHDFNMIAGARVLKPVKAVEQILDQSVRSTGAIDQLVGEYVGGAMLKAVGQNYGMFRTHRAHFNALLQVVNTVYVHEYQKAYRVRQEELIEEGTLQPGELLPRTEARAIEKQLQNLMPLVHTLYSKETDSLDEALFVGRYTTERMYGEGSVGTGLKTKQAVPVHKGIVKTRKDPKTGQQRIRIIPASEASVYELNTNTTTIAREIPDPELGVGAAILGIHSLDAYVAMEMLGNANVLSVFDGFGFAMGQEVDGAKQLNRHFHHAMQTYSLMDEANATFQRVLEHLKDNVAADSKELRELQKKIASALPKDIGNLNELIQRNHTIQSQVKAIKDEVTQAPGYWNQYYMENAAHGTEGADKLTKPELPTSEEAAIEQDLKVLETEETVAQPKVVANQSVWGALASERDVKHPIGPVTPAALRAFGTGTTVSGQTLVDTLYASLHKSQNKLSVRGRVVKALLGSMSTMRALKQVEVRLVTPDMDPSDLDYFGNADTVEMLQSNTFAATLTDQNGNAVIYVKSADFAYHGLAMETLAHELIHAVTAGTLRRLPNTHPVVKQLNAVLKAVKAEMSLDPALQNSEELQHATVNIRELVAWGLSNSTVQQLLKEIDVQKYQKSLNGRFKNAFSAMAATIRHIFFKGNSPSVTNAFDLLLEATSKALDLTEQNANPSAASVDAQRSPQDKMEDQVARMTPVELFDALEGSPTADATRLRSIVETLTQHLSMEELEARNRKRGVYSNTDLYMDALVNDRIPFISSVRSAGFDLSQQELFVLEQIEAATAAGVELNAKARQELDTLWEIARDRIPLNVFASRPDLDLDDPRNRAEHEAAERRRDWVFQPEIQHTRQADAASATGYSDRFESDYLGRFMGLAMVHTPFRAALENLDVSKAGKGTGTFSERLQRILNAILDVFSSFMGRSTPSARASERIEQLMQSLADVQVRHQSVLVQQMLRRLEQTSEKANAGMRVAMQKVDAFARSDKMLKSGNRIKSTAGAAISMVAGDRVDEYMHWLKEAFKPYRQGTEGIVGSLITEMAGQNKGNARFHNLLRYVKKRVDQARRHANQQTRDMIRDSFSRKLTDTEREALTAAVLETDLSSILNRYGMSKLSAMILSDVPLVQAIQDELSKAKEQLPKEVLAEIQSQAKYLAWFMATGENKSDAPLSLNAELMVLNGPNSQQLSGNARKAAVQLGDTLASLYALHYVPLDVRNELRLLLRDEARRDDKGHGVETMLRLHTALKQEALAKNFDGNPVQMMKGYLPEVVDPHVQFKLMPMKLTVEEQKDLERRGYTPSHVVMPDPNDPIQEPHRVWVSETDGLEPYMAAIVSMTNEKSKGSDVEYRTRKELAMMVRQKQQAAQQLSTQANIDPGSVKGSRMVPVYDGNGQIVRFRYMMTKANRKSLLKRSTLADDLLGHLAGSIVDKAESKELNAQTVKALKLQYQDDLKEGRDEFVLVGPNSTDPSLQEVYALLPTAMKEEIQKVWGSQGMLVRRDLVDLVFGYHKFSLTSWWNIPPEQRKLHQELFIQVAEMLLPKGTVSKLNLAGNLWQEIIREVKDIWVIKNLFTLMSNAVSNTTVLWASGVPVNRIIKWQQEGYNLISAYQKDQKALGFAEQALAVEKTKVTPDAATVRRLEGDIARLKNRMSQSKMHELIEAGVFQTIIEDLDVDEEEFSYKQRLTDKVDQLTAGIPESVKTVASELMLTRRSKAYQTLSHLTQVSDLVARYALYRHLTERKKNPLSKAEAIEKVVKRFVNYDVPTHRLIQWGNDMGLIWFSKYYLRIQAALWEMMKEEPARMLSLATTQGIVDFWNIYDSLATPGTLMNRFHNPIGAVITSPDDIITVQASGALID